MPSEVKPLDRVFAPLHRMMEAMNAVEPSINLCIIAYDKNDSSVRGEGLVISNLTSPEDLVRLLTQAIDGARVRKILFRTPRS